MDDYASLHPLQMIVLHIRTYEELYFPTLKSSQPMNIPISACHFRMMTSFEILAFHPLVEAVDLLEPIQPVASYECHRLYLVQSLSVTKKAQTNFVT